MNSKRDVGCSRTADGSSDDNANTDVNNLMRRTGAVPKTRIYSQQNIPNGVASSDLKLNNNNSIREKKLNGDVALGRCHANGVTSRSKEPSKKYCRSEPRPGPSNSSRCDFNGKVSDESDCSSDTGNDDPSCCDDWCVYTYKGDVADLPRSFLNLDLPENGDGQQEHSRNGSRGSSPEMDFLEMDFDPGPSCDAESDESSTNIELQQQPQQQQQPPPSPPPPPLPLEESLPTVITISLPEIALPDSPPLEINNLSQQNNAPLKNESPDHNVKPDVIKPLVPESFADAPWIPENVSFRTSSCNVPRESKGHHSFNGDLISPCENALPSTSNNTSSSLYHSTMEKQLVLDKQPTGTEKVSDIEKTMIWTEQEAALKQITQINTSSCGATAVLNVLQVLGYDLPSYDRLFDCVRTRLRSNNASLVTYLKSRSVAGSTHKDIIRGLKKLSDGKIYARFFHMYPERYVDLSRWLSYWIRKKAVPIATLNLQKGVENRNNIPDAWHHQMLFGVGPRGIYLTNPLERLEEGALWSQLSSESVLLVRREDVVTRWEHPAGLRELMAVQDVRWRRLNVAGQVAAVIREHRRPGGWGGVSRTHICIPAAYSAGVTLAVDVSNPACELLRNCPELPLLRS